MKCLRRHSCNVKYYKMLNSTTLMTETTGYLPPSSAVCLGLAAHSIFVSSPRYDSLALNALLR